MKNSPRIIVGTTNPSKIAATEKVFKHNFPGCKVLGVKVSSKVSEQPMTDRETYKGAYNRAIAALKSDKDADFGVGIEAGLEKHSYGWVDRMIVVIVNKDNAIGIGSSSGLVLPDKIVKKVLSGKTLGDAVDELFKTTKVGESIGMFGLLTNKQVTRSLAIEQAVAFALVRFLKPGLYS
jgi:inosine/xanthosine triphosphatase